MLPQYDLALVILIFSVVGLGMLLFVCLFSWSVRPLKERKRAQESYECGFPAKGDARAIGFNYLNYALLFLIFDLAALYLFLYASLTTIPAGVTPSFLLAVATLGLMIIYGTKKRRYYVA